MFKTFFPKNIIVCNFSHLFKETIFVWKDLTLNPKFYFQGTLWIHLSEHVQKGNSNSQSNHQKKPESHGLPPSEPVYSLEWTISEILPRKKNGETFKTNTVCKRQMKFARKTFGILKTGGNLVPRL